MNIDIGVGGGIGGSVKAFNLVEINVVPIKTDFWHLQLDEGKLQTGWKLKSAINAQIGPGGAGYYYTSFDPDPKGGPKIEEHGFNDNLGYGFELYFGLGIEINVGFSLLVLLEELDKMSNN